MQNTVYSVRREVSGYIVKNIFASLGISLYVLVDTLFIALAAGSIGLATLNIVLPIFNLFNSLGLLLGVGGAAIFSLIRFVTLKELKDFTVNSSFFVWD